jgi:hypothetical protein
MNNVLTYSPESAIDRQISVGSEFDSYFGKTENKRIAQKGNLSTRQTVLKMIDLINSKNWQTEKIAKKLQGSDLTETCKNIWNFCFKYIKYQKDIEEELREPNATWRDGQILARQYPNVVREDGVQYGVDCDCYSIFIGSILSNLNILFNIKMTSYVNSLGLDNGFQHVYIIVPLENNSYITIDPVVHAFNYEKPVSKYELFTLQKKIHSTMAQVFVLSGVEKEQSYNNSLIDIMTGRNMINGLFGEADNNSILEYLKSTRKAVTANPSLVTNQNQEDFVKMLDLGINNWADESKRASVLEQLSNMEDYLVEKKHILKGLEYEEISGFFNEVNQLNKEINSLGKTKAERKEKREDKKEARQEKRDERPKGTILNKLNKFNPVTLGVRNAYRTLFAINMFGISTIAASTDDKSKAVRTKIDNLYFSLGGKKEKLAKTIEKGKLKKPILNKDAKDNVEIEDDDLDGLGYLGVAGEVAAIVAAASVPLAATLKFISDAGISKKSDTPAVASGVTSVPADLNKDGKISLIEKWKNKKSDKKEKQNTVVESGVFDAKDLNKDGKVSLIEKWKAKKNEAVTTTTDTATTTTTDTTTTDTTTTDVKTGADTTTPSNDEKSLIATLGKLIKEHPLGFAIGTTAVVSGVALLFPQVREFVGISSNVKTKKLGYVQLS